MSKMRYFTLAFALAVSVTGPAFSQNAETAYDQKGAFSVFDLGGRSVRIPAPVQFTEAVTAFPHIAARVAAGENPMNEVLAVHVSNSIVPDLKGGGEPDLEFYTKVSVLKQIKATDITPDEFTDLADAFERQSPGALQTIVKNGEAGTTERLNNHWREDVGLKIGETRMLGYFGRKQGSVSSMFIMDVEMFKRRSVILGSMSMVHVNNRVLFLYVFRIRQSDKDREAVVGLTKSWIAATLAANSI